MLKKTIVKIQFIVIYLTVFFASGQALHQDSVRIIEEVIVTSNRLIRFSTGNKIEEIDSATLAQNNNNTLADLLSNNTQVFIKSYGIAGLSTPSFRGTNASQTAILWNGFNLSSPMNGGQDLALLPANFANNIKLQFGGAGALWGSGAIGGTIHLTNIPEFNKGLSIGTSLSLGSFEDQQGNLEIGISKNKFSSSIKVFHHQAKNNFTFLNNTKLGKPIETLKNSAFNQTGFLQENYFKVYKNQFLNFRIWYQENARELPASMTVALSKSTQTDKAFRSTLEWQRLKEKTAYFIRAAYFEEQLEYNDPLINLSSKSKSQTFISEVEAKIKITLNQTINIGINNTYNSAQTKEYIKNTTQDRTSIFGSYQIKNKRSTIKTTTSLRQEFISNGANPTTASLGIEAWALKRIRIKGNASKNYRVPTFNDLYWAQGGNPNLLPEKGYNAETGLAYVYCNEKYGLEAGITKFNSNISNWIMWIPNASGIWSPENIAKVWSRGEEYDLKFYLTFNKIKFNLGIHHQFIRTTNEAAITSNQASLHKQLIYTPQGKSTANLGIEYRKFRISCIYNYVDYRYTTSDNLEYLDPYQTIGLDLSKSIQMKNLILKAYLQVNNLTNESYQIIAYYPTPRKNFQVGITINFNKPNKK